VPAVLRLLLSLAAALALLVQPVATWAAAGVQGDVSCCCPDPDRCDCHDHKGQHTHDGPRMKRCGNGPVKLIAPVVLIATPPAPRPALLAPRTIATPTFTIPAMPVARADRPEKPPS
jgi:hypothetical protein